MDPSIFVLMNYDDEGFKKNGTGETFAGKTFIDFLGMRREEIIIDKHDFGELLCNTGSVLLWTLKE